jgi:hypothetical protein
MSRAFKSGKASSGGEGPWADANILHDGTDYAGLAKLWTRAKGPARASGPGPRMSRTRWQSETARHASRAGLDRCRGEAPRRLAERRAG